MLPCVCVCYSILLSNQAAIRDIPLHLDIPHLSPEVIPLPLGATHQPLGATHQPQGPDTLLLQLLGATPLLQVIRPPPLQEATLHQGILGQLGLVIHLHRPLEATHQPKVGISLRREGATRPLQAPQVTHQGPSLLGSMEQALATRLNTCHLLLCPLLPRSVRIFSR